SQTRTWSSTDGCGNTSTAARTVSWTFDVTAPTLVGVPAAVDVECDASVAAPPNVIGTDNCGGSVTVTMTQTSVDTDCSTGFRQVVTRTWTATDGCGNTSTAQQIIRVKCCGLNCTYTQGAWGSAGGMMCNGQPSNPGPNQFTTYQAIWNSLDYYTLAWYPAGASPTLTVPYPNPPFTDDMLVMGKPGRSVYIHKDVTDDNLTIKYLPGGTSAKELVAGNMSIHDAAFEATYTKNSHIQNSLFAQNFALGLNIGFRST